MKKHVLLVAIGAASLSLGVNRAGAANLPPPSGNPITATMDGGTALGGDTWYQIGVNTAAPTTGLPTGTITSKTTSTISYVMPSYATGNDALLLGKDIGATPGTVTGTINFLTPVAASNLAFLTSTGSAGGPGGKGGPITVVLNLSDGTTQTLTATLSSPDWFGNTPIGVTTNGRVSRNGTTGADQFDNVNSNNPNLYDETIATGTAPTALIKGVTLTVAPTAANSNTVVFAVSSSLDGTTYTPIALDPSSFNQSVVVTTPEPASFGLLGLTGLGLLARRRRA